jgi:ribosomal protein S18 acetylase RimI-like enzyme
MPIAFRPAVADDYEYCERLYFDEMTWIMDQLRLDRVAQQGGFRVQWILAQVRIITRDGFDVGWLQTTIQEDALFILQLFVDGSFQRRGIGTEVMKRLIQDHFNQSVLLEVVKINPALRLYERLGFQITHEAGHKFRMRRDPDTAT